MKKMFENNLDALGIKDPVLADRVMKSSPDRSWRILTTPNGQVTARKLLENGSRSIHSCIDPKREATRWGSIVPNTTGVMVLLGFGLGYTALELQKRGCGESLVVVERSVGLFRLAMEWVDMTSLITDPALSWLIDEEPAALQKILPPVSSNLLSYRIWPPVTALYDTYYQSIREILERRILEQRLQMEPDLGRGLGKLLSEMV